MNDKIDKLLKLSFFRIAHQEDGIINNSTKIASHTEQLNLIKRKFVDSLFDTIMPLSTIEVKYENNEATEMEISLDLVVVSTKNYNKLLKLLEEDE